MRVPSGETVAFQTSPPWPLRTAIALPVTASQTRAVLSAEAVTTRAPSGARRRQPLDDPAVMAAEDRDRLARRRIPNSALFRPMRPTTRVPSGEKAALQTTSS